MGRTLISVVIGAAAISGSWPGGLPREGGDRDTAPARPLVSWIGSESRADAGYFRITTAEAWKDFWLRHQGERVEHNSRGWTVVPEIDFGSCMVVGFIRGPSTSCDGETLQSIEAADGVLRLRFDSLSYQTASFGPGPAPRPQTLHPYGIWVMPRSSKPLLIEENVQDLIDGNPVWEARKRFDAPGN